MRVYAFGNKDVSYDNLAFKVADKFKGKLKNVEFIKVAPNEDLPFVNEKQVIILDEVEGIDEVIEINNEDLDKLVQSKSSTVHDFDLGFQLRYLQKIGKLGKVNIIGLPMNKKVDYLRVQSILRKLVAHDMQGS
jgi:Ni,Fe-hydrogenase maturation factor